MEKQYFGSTTNASPNVICSNGINTVREAYITGLNPLGTNSFRMQMNGDVFNWNTVSGRVYDIHFTTNLLNGFTPLYTNIPWIANSPTHPAEGFYRLKVRLP